MSNYRGDGGALRRIMVENGIDARESYRDSYMSTRHRRIKISMPKSTNDLKVVRAIREIGWHFGDRVVEVKDYTWGSYMGDRRALVLVVTM